MGKAKMKETGIPYGAREKMPFWYSLAWSSRGISAALNVILVAYVTFYASDVLGLSVGIVGTMLLASRVIDAFTDMAMGFIIDKTHTRWGKARPYEIFIVLTWLFTVLLFNTPSGSRTFQYIWLFVMYVLINAICTTAYGGTDAVYMARAFTTENNRVKVMSINGVVVMFASILFNIIAPQFINSLGTTQAGWTKLSMTMAVPLALIGMLRFFLCKEIVEDKKQDGVQAQDEEKQDNLKLSDMMKLLLKNRYVFIVVGLMITCQIANNLGPVATYYFKYMMGDIGLLSLVNVTAMVVPLALIFFPVLSRKFGTTKILQACAVIGIAGMAIRTVGRTNMATLIIGSTLSGIATMPISMMINAYLIDCMDYGEWKTGVRIEGPVASVVNFSNKVGAGLASGLIGLIMGLAGYDGTLEVQSASANAAIVGCYNILPLILYILMLALALNYKMDKLRPQIQADLQKGKKQG